MATPGFLEEEENEQQDDDDDFAVMKPCPRTKQKVFVKSQTRQESIACQISPLLVPAAMQKEKRKAETHMTERGASGNAPGNTPIAKKTRSHATPASTGPESIFGEADQLFSCPICTKNVKNRHMDAHISSSCVHYIEKVAPASIMDSFARVSSPSVVVASLPDSSPIDLDFETAPRIVNSAKQFIPVESRLQPALRDLQTPHPNGLSQQPPIFAEAYDIEFDLPPTSPALLSFVNSTQVTVNEADGMEDEFGEAVDTCMSTTSERAFVAPVSAFLDEGEVTEDEAAQEDPDRKRKRESPSVSDSANDPRTGEKEQMPGQDERAESEAVTPESRERRLAARNAILADLTGSIVDARKPKPSVAYDTLKDAQLRRLLKDEGLRATGDKATLKRRHKEFTLLHNANLDSLHPKPQTAVLAAMVAWEKTHGELSSGAGSVASGLGASAAFQGHKASEDGVASDARHVKKYHGEFERMVEELRERKRRKVEAREKEMHSKDVQNS
ncbi:hypothetical protein BC830DRAFT_1171930 [Chytriomyces sp. MP71]|nr:hypothetical protein BC830DRAFT_1171930 [Chytriomyces sp. MP71]